MNILDFKKMKQAGRKISIITCYDAWSAKIITQSNIDCVLVGDSLAMVVYGHLTTLPATVELMEEHVKAVARGINHKFIIADMPFLAHRKNLNSVMRSVEKLMRAGAQAIKLEGVRGNEKIIRHIIESGVPVMGHIGMTPQFFHQFGGFSAQGKTEEAAEVLLQEAKILKELGCFAIVLECVPPQLAKKITESVSIVTIGIGAGPHVDGQVLVLHDMLGMSENFQPKFVKKFMEGFTLIQNALNNFDKEVKDVTYPSQEHCY
jgi:3-methyl-2-oxobutanoate hydroxymethyltransferase